MNNFTEIVSKFREILQDWDKNNPILLRIIDDQLMFLEQAFLKKGGGAVKNTHSWVRSIKKEELEVIITSEYLREASRAL